MSSQTPLRRSLLFVPGGEDRRLEKAKQTNADTLIFDLEDSVPYDKKEQARDKVTQALQQKAFGESEPTVRVNGPQSPFFEDDVIAVVQAGARAIMLPKSENLETLKSLCALIEKWEATPQSVQILALVETPLGTLKANELCSDIDRITALCFGHADFALEMGLAEADAAQGAILHARCQIAITGKSYQVTPVDNVCLFVKDETTFRQDVALGIQLGFEGKMCIHPMQVEIANAMYTPSSEQIEYANRVIRGWDEAQKSGLAVFTLDGQMLDYPLVAAQQKILHRATKAGLDC
ncbi:MAG: CoA ester lyase [Pseudomonadales bacterium]|nr:CoA ester lyase [Pseudomonadales bacterium]